MMYRNFDHVGCMELGTVFDLPAEIYGAQASAISDIRASGFPTPNSWALSMDAVRNFSKSVDTNQWPIISLLQSGTLLSVRSSPEKRKWGGPSEMLNVGMNNNVFKTLRDSNTGSVAARLYCTFIQDFAIQTAGSDGDSYNALVKKIVEHPNDDHTSVIEHCFCLFENEVGIPFPQDPVDQLGQVLQSMSRAWESTTSRILREALGAPQDAGLGLLIQEAMLGSIKEEFGVGQAQFVSPVTGATTVHGSYQSHFRGKEMPLIGLDTNPNAADTPELSLEIACPDAFRALASLADRLRKHCHDEMRLEFSIDGSNVFLLDIIPAQRSRRAEISIAVQLKKLGVISRDEALVRVDPESLNEVMHPQIGSRQELRQIAEGIGASPGAASGMAVFSAQSAMALKARGQSAILVSVETSPDDIHGMHSSGGIVTQRGGSNSHAAVVARALGVPCVVGALGLSIESDKKKFTSSDGTEVAEGDVITLDGASGKILWGAVDLAQPELGEDFHEFIQWADSVRTLGIRANADTPHDVELARAFSVDGIGLVRTEHMLFESDRLKIMHELIFESTDIKRQKSLDALLPMLRDDFVEIFSTMKGLPVCIRLLDPPLHEFLPKSNDHIEALASAMKISVSEITEKIEGLQEFNPMLGMRGVRLGITVPAIYDMQARAIFEAVCEVEQRTAADVAPEIMIPLVVTNQEVEFVKTRIAAIAALVEAERGRKLMYSLGVMVETPRAALQAGKIAQNIDFMSFGTNDLTQMVYGLSRDDSGRFMRDYIRLGIFPEDPFDSLDIDGVAKIMTLAIDDARSVKPGLSIGLCGEHGGDTKSVWICHDIGIDYVSCSPFRVPIAKLAAAQAVLIKTRKRKT